MPPLLWTIIFIVALILSVACRFILSMRQKRAVLKKRGALPIAFSEKLTLAAHQKAADYTVAKEQFSMVDTLFDTALLFVWTLGGGVFFLAQITETLPYLWRDVLLVMMVSVIGGALSLPFSYYRTFVIEARFGFNKTTRALWAMDTLKGAILGLIIGAPLLALVLWLVSVAGSWWWLWAGCAVIAFQCVMLIIYPTVIAPIFNKFTPLPESDTRAAICALLERCGFTAKGLFLMDGSKRTGHGNAYFTGLGSSKRIVFFDTLFDRLKQDEILAVLAHELGHFKKHHIKKRMATSAIITIIVFALLAILMKAAWFYEGLGFSPESALPMMDRPGVALTLFMLVFPVFSFFLTPIASWASRRHEFEADDYGAKETSPDALARALVSLYEDNAATVTPDALYSMFYDSHPPAPARVARLEEKIARAS